MFNRTSILFVFSILAIVAFITLAPNNILLDIKPKHHKNPLPLTFANGLKPNTILTDTTKLFNGIIHGPESIVSYNGKLYTGTNDGYIYRIDSDTLMTPIIKINDRICTESWTRVECARPLGLKINSKGILYIADANSGVKAIDLSNDKPKIKTILTLERTQTLGKASKFFDDIAIDENAGKNGGDIIYVTDVSTKFDITHVMLIIGGSDKGRILKYDINADILESVVNGTYFPNGIELTDDKKALLYAETTTRRIFKYHISGKSAGKTEIITNFLPGEPDNIRRSAIDKETYWVGIAMARNASSETTLDFMGPKPLMKKLVFRTLHLVGSGIEAVGKIFNNPVIREFGFNVKSGSILLHATVNKAYGMVIEIDNNGNIINSLHSPDGTITMVSEAQEVRINNKETALYIGSYRNDYLGKLILNR